MVKTPLVRIALSFLKAYIAAFAVLVPGILAAPDLSAAKGLTVAALIAALDAVFKSVQIALESRNAVVP